MRERVSAFLTQRSSYRCLLIANPNITQLRTEIDKLVSEYSLPALSIGSTISERLLSVPPRRRSAEAATALKAALRDLEPGPVVCSDIDLLFEPALKLDPLRLFSTCSRFTRLIVAWPGNYTDGTLSYAVPEHSHYHAWKNPDVEILPLCR